MIDDPSSSFSSESPIDDTDPTETDSNTTTSGHTASASGPVGGTGVTTVDGCRIAYRRAGTDGPPVVLLHGGGVDDALLSWRHTIDRLADEYRVYALDWPGYGDSVGSVEHSVERYAALLDSFLDAVGLDTATLVGLSMGGATALGLALETPQRVDRLVLVNSYGLGSRLPVGSLWKAAATIPGMNAMGWAAMGASPELARIGLTPLVSSGATLDPQFVRDFRSRARAPGAGTAFEAFQRNEITVSGRSRTDFSDRLGSLSMPTLLVHGADDPVVPPAWAADAAGSIPDAEVAILENCGHWTPRERPDRFGGVLTTFLTRAAPSREETG